jgi:hypothetical protein
MQTIKVECQHCESVEEFEADGFILIMKTKEGQQLLTGHDADPGEWLMNGLQTLPEDEFEEFYMEFIAYLRQRRRQRRHEQRN